MTIQSTVSAEEMFNSADDPCAETERLAQAEGYEVEVGFRRRPPAGTDPDRPERTINDLSVVIEAVASTEVDSSTNGPISRQIGMGVRRGLRAGLSR